MDSENRNLALKAKLAVLFSQIKDKASHSYEKMNSSDTKKYITDELAPKMASLLGKAASEASIVLKNQIKKISADVRSNSEDAGLLHWKSIELTGDETDRIVWTFSFLLKNGHYQEMTISSADKYRLERIITENSKTFAVFDTTLCSAALKVSDAIFWQFLIAPPYSGADQHKETVKGQKLHMNLWFSSFEKSRSIYVDKDSTNSFTDPDQTPLRNLLVSLDNAFDENEIFETTDENGEKIYFKGTALSLVTIPLEALGEKVSVQAYEASEVSKKEEKQSVEAEPTYGW